MTLPRVFLLFRGPSQIHIHWFGKSMMPMNDFPKSCLTLCLTMLRSPGQPASMWFDCWTQVLTSCYQTPPKLPLLLFPVFQASTAPWLLAPPPQVSRKKGVAEAYLPPRIQYEAWTAPLPYWILGKVQEVQNTCANKQKKHLNLQKFDRGIGDFRCQSRTLVRGAQQSFDPKGFPEPKICLKLGGFPKNCLKTAWFWRNLGGKGGWAPRAPLDLLLDLSLPQLGGTVN